jgi:hypothetical protein
LAAEAMANTASTLAKNSFDREGTALNMSISSSDSYSRKPGCPFY